MTLATGREPGSGGNGPDRRHRFVGAAFGLAVAFVVAVALVRWLRPEVLFGPDRSWWRLWLLVFAGSCGTVFVAGRVAARLLVRFLTTPLGNATLQPLPASRTVRAAVAVLALGVGALLRLAWLHDPPPLFSDEVTLVAPTLALEGSLRDFLPPYRPAPYGVEKPFGSVGVVYLAAFRLSLDTLGTNLAGLRLISVLGGVASLLTATLLARALLPAGGGTLAALALAGLRWHLIMSSWGWVAVCVAPVLDLAALSLVHGRERRSGALTFAAGALAGLGGHVYLAAWIGFAALLLWRLWPLEDAEPARSRLRHAALLSAGFLVAILPLFLLAGPSDPPYFARVGSHNLLREFRLRQSVLPFFEVTADSLASPWFVPEPQGWADLPDRSRLGLVLGSLVAIALARALSRPRDSVSAFLLAHAAAAFAASVAQGSSGCPNGYRFVYLTTPTAIAAAAGALALAGVLPRGTRQLGTVVLVGLIAVSGALAAGDALVRWPVSRFRFDGFKARETVVGEAAERWRAYGTVSLEVMERSVLLSALSSLSLFPGPSPASRGDRRIRICGPGGRPREGERPVELIRDPWGGLVARVFAAP